MVTTTERALTPAEVQLLADRIGHARREGRDALMTTFGGSLLAGGVLWLVTSIGAGSAWQLTGLFWLLAATTFGLWIGEPAHRTMRDQVASLVDAMHASRVKITRVQSSRVVQFEAEKNEGACYAFEVDASTCLFIVGHEFDDANFPNSDFSVVDLLGTHGRPVDTMLEKSGSKLTPERVIAASVKRLVEIPEHRTTINAALELVEHALGKPTGRGYA